MHLIYVDESGNTGKRCDDPSQPIFGLCAMIVEETCWRKLDSDLAAVLDRRFPAWREIPGFEIHAADIRNGRGAFKAWDLVEPRIALRDELMEVGRANGVKLIFRSVQKAKYAKWMSQHFGGGVTINPHVAAFALVVRTLESYLRSLPGEALGILISDENKEIVKEVENSLKLLKNTTGELKLTRIIEKGFFIDSKKSLPLQLCDLFAMSLRKHAEREIGLPAKSIDDSGIAIARSLTHEDRKQDGTVIDWLRGALK